MSDLLFGISVGAEDMRKNGVCEFTRRFNWGNDLGQFQGASTDGHLS